MIAKKQLEVGDLILKGRLNLNPKPCNANMPMACPSMLEFSVQTSSIVFLMADYLSSVPSTPILLSNAVVGCRQMPS
jgi:hypothetical protein